MTATFFPVKQCFIKAAVAVSNCFPQLNGVSVALPATAAVLAERFSATGISIATGSKSVISIGFPQSFRGKSLLRFVELSPLIPESVEK
jgi:hypothetical protein